MGKNHLRHSALALFSCVWLIAMFSACCHADTVLYNDSTWIVNGVDDVDPDLNRIDVSVGGQPAGSFTELTVFRSFAGGFPLVYSIKANGSLSPAVPPSGIPAGAFHLTGYWDCFAGQQLDLRITSLDIEPNTKNVKDLRFSGTLSNGSTFQSSDLTMKLYLPNDGTVRLDVRYTLYATDNLCVDQSRQFTGEGFQVARMSSTYLSNEIEDNNGARLKGYVGQKCGCCSCHWITGYLCANFVNETGYVFPYQAWMAGPQLQMLHSAGGSTNTASLRIDLKKPSRSKCSAQGYTVLATDPAEDNVNLWINWDYAKSQYTAGQKVLAFRFTLVALPPGPESCDLFVP